LASAIAAVVLIWESETFRAPKVVTPVFEIVISPDIATSAGLFVAFPTKIWPSVRAEDAPIGIPLKVS
jgi:hypothetical protein